jgi:FKBP-type peptidyl-prolyl cis-trans isomerase
MRRFLALIAVPLMACLTLAACSSGKSASSSSASAGATAGGGSVTATGAFDKAPKVTIPKAKPDNKLTVKTLIQGTGTTLTASDILAANFELYYWDGTSSTQKANTYPTSPALIGGSMLPGLKTALAGKKVGSRILAVIPPAQAFGKSGDPQYGITGSTTLVFVIDVLKSYAKSMAASGAQESNGGGGLPTVNSPKPGNAPTVTIPSSGPPAGLQTRTLLKGSGPKLTKGEFVVAQYVGYIWRTKKAFNSSWATGTPFGFIIGATKEQVIPGWDKGLEGQTVGSRVMMSIPPAEGYGKTGASQVGIKATDTLVFVVDILDAIQPSTSS